MCASYPCLQNTRSSRFRSDYVSFVSYITAPYKTNSRPAPVTPSVLRSIIGECCAGLLRSINAHRFLYQSHYLGVSCSFELKAAEQTYRQTRAYKAACWGRRLVSWGNTCSCTASANFRIFLNCRDAKILIGKVFVLLHFKLRYFQVKKKKKSSETAVDTSPSQTAHTHNTPTEKNEES